MQLQNTLSHTPSHHSTPTHVLRKLRNCLIYYTFLQNPRNVSQYSRWLQERTADSKLYSTAVTELQLYKYARWVWAKPTILSYLIVALDMYKACPESKDTQVLT